MHGREGILPSFRTPHPLLPEAGRHGSSEIARPLATVSYRDPGSTDKAALAAILDAQGRYAEAEELYRQALEVFERVYGPEHYEIAVNLNNLAAIHQARGQAAEAERLYLRTLEIKQKLLGTDHPDLAMTLHNLATLFADLGRPAEAKALFRHALAMFERTVGREHPHFLVCLEHYERVRRR